MKEKSEYLHISLLIKQKVFAWLNSIKITKVCYKIQLSNNNCYSAVLHLNPIVIKVQEARKISMNLKLLTCLMGMKVGLSKTCVSSNLVDRHYNCLTLTQLFNAKSLIFYANMRCRRMNSSGMLASSTTRILLF